MTPQDALAAALAGKQAVMTYAERETLRSWGEHGPDHWEQHADDDEKATYRKYAASILAALPAGWRLTDEPEVTVEALAQAICDATHDSHDPDAILGAGELCWSAQKKAEPILAALRGAS